MTRFVAYTKDLISVLFCDLARNLNSIFIAFAPALLASIGIGSIIPEQWKALTSQKFLRIQISRSDRSLKFVGNESMLGSGLTRTKS